MAPRKGIARTKKRTPQQGGGVNPLLVALGAGAGAVAGRKATNTIAGRNVSNRIAAQRAKMSDPNMFVPEGRGTAAARLVAEAEYRNMPRVKNKGKVATYNDLMANEEKQGRSAGAYERSRKTAGLSKEEFDTLYAKKGAKVDMSLAKMSGSSQQRTTDIAKRLRAGNTRGRNTRRGGAAGGALAVLAQLVAAEMSKKK